MADNILEIVIKAKDEFTGTMKGLTDGLPGLGAAAAAAGAAVVAAGTAIFTMTKHVAEAHAKIFDFSQQLGLSTEFISKMQYSAQLAGVEFQQLEMGLKRLSIGIGEASFGTGEAKQAFDTLGISVKDASGNVKTAEELFPEIAGALENVGSASQKAAIAAQIFGARGTAMLQVLAEGREGLEDMWKEAEKFGVVVSEQAARNADNFDDAITKVNMSFKGLQNTMAEELMPILAALANRFANFVAENREGIIEFVKKSLEVLATFVEYGAYGVAVLIDAWRGLQMIWQVLVIAATTLADTVVRALGYMTEKATGFMQTFNIGGVFDEAIGKANNFNAALKSTSGELQATADAAWGRLNELVSQGLATGRVAEYAQAVKDILAGLYEEGDAGVPPFTNKNVGAMIENAAKAKEGTQANIDALIEMWGQYYLTETERLDLWYAMQQEKYAANNEAMLLLNDIYWAKKEEMDLEKQAQAYENLRALHEEWTLTEMERLDLWYQQQLEMFQFNEEAKTQLAEIYAARRLKIEENEKAKGKKLDQDEMVWKKTFSDGIGAILAAGAQESAVIAKAKAVFDTVMATQSGAIKAYEALAWIPVVGPALGQAAAAAVIAFGMARLATINSATYAAHGGMTYVPNESTYLLNKGERVLSPRQNEDLTDYMEGGGQGVTIQNLHVEAFPNATNVNALKDMDRRDWEDIVSEKIIPAMRTLAAQGVKV